MDNKLNPEQAKRVRYLCAVEQIVAITTPLSRRLDIENFDWYPEELRLQLIELKKATRNVVNSGYHWIEGHTKDIFPDD